MLRKHHAPGRHRGPIRWRPFPAGRLSSADVIAGLALFVALGGTASPLSRSIATASGLRRSAATPSAPPRSPTTPCGHRRSAAAPSAPPRSATRASRPPTSRRRPYGVARRAEGHRGRERRPPHGADVRRKRPVGVPEPLELALASAADSSRQANPAPTQPTEPTPGIAGSRGRPELADPGQAARGDRPEPALRAAVGRRQPVRPRRHQRHRRPGRRCSTRPRSAKPGRVSSENIALSAVVPKRLRNPTVALRCTSQTGDRVTASFIKITALTVGTVTGA